MEDQWQMSPNQMFIKSGGLVVDPPDNPPGTYFRYLMTIGNNECYIYINASDLINADFWPKGECVNFIENAAINDLVYGLSDIEIDVSDYL